MERNGYIFSELTTLVLVFQIKAADSVCIKEQPVENLCRVVLCSRHFHISLYTVCGNEEEKGLCSHPVKVS